MPTELPKVKITGLHTYNSEFAGVPEGSLRLADNLTLNRLNVAEPRRGFNPLAHDLPSGTDRAKEFLFYQNIPFVHTGLELFAYDETLGFTSRGAFSAPAGRTVKWATAAKNLYVTGSDGVKKLDSASTSVQAVGCPKGLFIETADTGGSGFLDSGEMVMYRYVIGKKDANSNLILGGVSAAIVHTCAATSRNVAVTCFIPGGLTSANFIQLYRSLIGTTTPKDELQQCYETFVTSTDIANGYVSITDIVPDDLLGGALYTNASQEGLSQDNAQPPVAKDLAVYKSCMFYGNTVGKQRFFLTLIAAGSPGLVVNDTVTVAGAVYTAKASFNQANREFVVDVSSPSPSVRIDNTVRSLIKCINRNATGTVYAYLLSDESDLPGKMFIEERSTGGAAFTALSSKGVAFSPVLDTTAGVNQTSTNDTNINGLMFSKPGIHEAVPLINLILVGSSEAKLIRIKALRDGLMIMKDDGAFVLRGEDPSTFQVTLLDGTARLLAENALAEGNNQLFGLCDIGAVLISDTGVNIISVPIKDQLLELFGLILDEVQSLAYVTAYETEGKFLLALPVFNGDTFCKQIFVYDFYGDTWTRWLLNVFAMAVNEADGKLYLGSGDRDQVRIERKAYDFSDYADYGQLTTISAFTDTTLTLSGVDDMSVGDVISQGDLDAYITSVNPSAGQVEVDVALDWTLATADHLKGVAVEMEFNAEACGNPAGYKQFVEAIFLFKRSFIKGMTFTFSTDENPSASPVTKSTQEGTGNWGDFDWGEAIFGGDPSKLPVRVTIPRNASRGSQLITNITTRTAYSDWQLEGWAPIFNPAGTRVAR